jgi:hypothetical protein
MAQPQPQITSLFSGNQPILPPAATPPITALTTTTPNTGSSGHNTFVMTASPSRNRKSTVDGSVYRPKLISTVGAKPACLVNASVTYVGNDQIYAFGGFDQFTDEGRTTNIHCPIVADLPSIQPCPSLEPRHSPVESRRQLWGHTGGQDGPYGLSVARRQAARVWRRERA